MARKILALTIRCASLRVTNRFEPGRTLSGQSDRGEVAMKDIRTLIDRTPKSDAPSKEAQKSGQTEARDVELALTAARRFMDRYPDAMRKLAQ